MKNYKINYQKNYFFQGVGLIFLREIFFHHFSFCSYHSIVDFNPSSNFIFGVKPNSFLIKEELTLYHLSCPGLSTTKEIRSVLLKKSNIFLTRIKFVVSLSDEILYVKDFPHFEMIFIIASQ